MNYHIYSCTALVIASDTGLVANASRWVSGQMVQHERRAQAAGNTHDND